MNAPSFDINIAERDKREKFNTIVKDFTRRITVHSPVDLVRVEVLSVDDTGRELKYYVTFTYGGVNSIPYGLKQSTVERLVALSCERDGIVNKQKCKNMLIDIDMSLIEFAISSRTQSATRLQKELDEENQCIVKLQSALESLRENKENV